MLWNKYWASTLAQSPVVVNRKYTVGQLDDLAEKLRRSEGSVARRGGGLGPGQVGNGGEKETTGSEKETKEQKVEQIMNEMNAREAETPLAKAANDRLVIGLGPV